jgi:hypothetical protein
MNGTVQDAEEVIVGPGENESGRIWECGILPPLEYAMFRYPAGDAEPGHAIYGLTHRWPGLYVNPPRLGIGCASVLRSLRLNPLGDKPEWRFIRGGLLHGHLAAEVDDPHAAVALRDVRPIDPRRSHHAVGLPVGIGLRENLAGLRAGDIERPALGVAHERDTGVLRKNHRLCGVFIRCEVSVDVANWPAIQYRPL